MNSSSQNSQIVGSTELLIGNIQTHLAEKGSGAVELVAVVVEILREISIPEDAAGSSDPEVQQAFVSISSRLENVYSIIHFKLQEALALPDDNSAKPLKLKEAGDLFYTLATREARFRDKAIEAYSDAAKLIPDHDDLHMKVVAILGQCLLLRIQDKGLISDMNTAILCFEQCVAVTSQTNAAMADNMVKLGDLLMSRFQQTGDLADIDRAISLQTNALKLIPDGHAEMPGSLNTLGNSFFCRFEETRNVRDIDRAISLREDAVRLTSEDNSDKPSLLSDLGNSFFHRFKHTGDLKDVDKAILLQEDAVRLTPEDHEDRLSLVHDLGLSAFCRFQSTGDLRDIDRAISLQEDAVKLLPEHHSYRPACLNNLGNSFVHRFGCTGDLRDVDRAISLQEESVILTPEGYAERLGRQNNLQNSFVSRFEQTGDLRDIDRAISLGEDTVRATPEGHANKPMYLNNLGNSFFCRFGRTGNCGDIDRAILLQEDAVRLTPDGHADKPGRLNNLGNSVFSHYGHTGELRDIERAISLQEEAVRLTPDGHTFKPSRLSNLGTSFVSRFKHIGELDDVNTAISLQEGAVRLTKDGNADKAGHLNNLGHSYMCRFENTWKLRDLETAISLQEDVLRLTSDGHYHRPGRLSNLGNSLVHHFEHTGDLRDIDRAISLQEVAMRLTPDGQSDKAICLSNLAISLSVRFKHIKELSDINKAISLQEDTVRLTPKGHSDKPTCLSNLGHLLLQRFQDTGELRDVERAIALQEDAVRLTPDGHADKPICLSNLGYLLIQHFQHSGELREIDRAISLQEDAVKLSPTGHADKLRCISHLGISLAQCFEHTGQLIDIERAISLQENAVRFIPEGHADKPTYLTDLGNSLQLRFLKTAQHSDLELATHYYEVAATSSTGISSQCFFAASQWARLSYSVQGAPVSLKAYTIALDLMPIVAWLGQTISEHHNRLNSIGNIASESASAAIASDQFGLALEWLEQGRSIVWQQLLNLRTPVDDLHDKEPALANELVQISRALELSGSKDNNIMKGSTTVAIGNYQYMEIAAQKHHRLAEEWEALVKKIRSLPGFEYFLKPKKLPGLIKAASNGPVVVINIHQRQCDALVILMGHDEVIHVPLNHFSYEKASKMQNFLFKMLKFPNLRERGGGKVESALEGGGFRHILAELWSDVVKPVLDSLVFMDATVAGPPRIWWCPTEPLSFLPIHAAGVYDQSQDALNISNFVCSSYTPSLTALLNGLAAQNMPHIFKGILAISQKETTGKSMLPSAEHEVNQVLKHAQNYGIQNALHISGPSVTAEQVISHMEEFSWVHLACHAVQVTGTPANSAFCLNDGPLQLSRIITMSNKDAEFAFLSACQTATGDKNLSEEAAHLAAGMQLAGYRSVIATMWSIGDSDAPIVADTVYSHLFSGAKPDGTQAAYALHHAVKEFRKEVGDTDFMRWVPFIHVGI